MKKKKESNPDLTLGTLKLPNSYPLSEISEKLDAPGKLRIPYPGKRMNAD